VLPLSGRLSAFEWARYVIELHLPFPPSANSLWRRAAKGMRRSDSYTAWLTEAGWAAKQQRPGKIAGPYKLSIHAARPDNRRRDLDNLFKATSDLLESLEIIQGDHLAEMVCARWVTSGEGITVIVEAAGTEQ
jgi:crossover junction endodeoxyribonuclease RusA